jgi:hypothetical protein
MRRGKIIIKLDGLPYTETIFPSAIVWLGYVLLSDQVRPPSQGHLKVPGIQAHRVDVMQLKVQFSVFVSKTLLNK